MPTLAFYIQQREKLVEDAIESLLSLSGEYYPFTPENLGEALTQADEKTIFRLAVLAASSDELPDNPYSSRNLAICLRSIANTYWYSLAKEKVEKEIPSAEEMANPPSERRR